MTTYEAFLLGVAITLFWLDAEVHQMIANILLIILLVGIAHFYLRIF